MSDALARWLYPRERYKTRQKKLRFLLITLGVGVAASLLMGGLLYSINRVEPSKPLPELPGVKSGTLPAGSGR